MMGSVLVARTRHELDIKSMATRQVQHGHDSKFKEMRNVLLKHTWDFIVYEENGNMLISVIFHQSYTDTSRIFRLSVGEHHYDLEQFKILAEEIRNNYQKYKDREVQF